MREKIIKFMRGRYGADEFSRFLVWVVIGFWVVSIILRSAGRDSQPLATAGVVTDYISFVAIIYCLFRMFSKNISKRQKENRLYLKYKTNITGIFRAKNTDKTYKIYKCPQCGQKVRVPKNKGKIAISCPNCKKEFVKRT